MAIITQECAIAQSITIRCGSNKVKCLATNNKLLTKKDNIIDRMFFAQKEMSLEVKDFANKEDSIQWEFLYLYHDSKKIPRYDHIKGGHKIVVKDLDKLLFHSNQTKIIITLNSKSKGKIIVVLDVSDKDYNSGLTSPIIN